MYRVHVVTQSLFRGQRSDSVLLGPRKKARIDPAIPYLSMASSATKSRPVAARSPRLGILWRMGQTSVIYCIVRDKPKQNDSPRGAWSTDDHASPRPCVHDPDPGRQPNEGGNGIGYRLGSWWVRLKRAVPPAR